MINQPNESIKIRFRRAKAIQADPNPLMQPNGFLEDLPTISYDENQKSQAIHVGKIYQKHGAYIWELKITPRHNPSGPHLWCHLYKGLSGLNLIQFVAGSGAHISTTYLNRQAVRPLTFCWIS